MEEWLISGAEFNLSSKGVKVCLKLLRENKSFNSETNVCWFPSAQLVYFQQLNKFDQ